MSQKMKAYSALLSVALIWGMTFHIAKYASNAMPMFLYLALRFWIATAAAWLYLLAFTVASRSPEKQPQAANPGNLQPLQGPTTAAPKLTTASAVVVGVCLAVFYALQVRTVSEDAVNAAFLTTTAVLWIPPVSMLLLTLLRWRGGAILNRLVRCRVCAPSVLNAIDVSITKSLVFGIGLTVAGLMIIENFDLRANFTVEDLLGLLGAFALALEIVISSAVSKGADKADLLKWTIKFTLVGAVLFTCISIASGDLTKTIVFDRKVLAALLFTGVLATAVANFLATWSTSLNDAQGEQVISSVHRSIMENLDAPVALLIGIVFIVHPDSIAASRYLGCGLIAAGVLISETGMLERIWGRSSPSNDPQEPQMTEMTALIPDPDAN